MICTEISYLRFLLESQEKLTTFFQAHLTYQPREKWIIADARIEPAILNLKTHLAKQPMWQANIEQSIIEAGSQPFAALPELIKAFAAEGLSRAVFDLLGFMLAQTDVCIQQQHCDDNLLIAYANMSLILAQHRQQMAMALVQKTMETLLRLFVQTDTLIITYAYVLRNTYVMNDQLHQVEACKRILEEFKRFKIAHESLLPVLEEYARVLSNAVTSFLLRHYRVDAMLYFQELSDINRTQRSDKIRSAWVVASKNLEQNKM